MTTILQGENRLLSRQLVQSDGITPVVVAGLVSVRVDLLQRGAVLASYTLGVDAPLRAAVDASTVTLELTTAFTLANLGAIRERWTLTRTNADFVAEPTHEQVDCVVLDDIEIR